MRKKEKKGGGGGGRKRMTPLRSVGVVLLLLPHCQDWKRGSAGCGKKVECEKLGREGSGKKSSL